MKNELIILYYDLDPSEPCWTFVLPKWLEKQGV